MTKFFTLEGIGPVKLTKNPRFRNLKITVRPSSGISVSVPELVSFTEAERFVTDKKVWIKNSVEKMQKITDKRTVFDITTSFHTREHKLIILPHHRNSIQIIIKNRIIHVFYPNYADVKDDRIQNCIRRAVSEAWRIEAK